MKKKFIIKLVTLKYYFDIKQICLVIYLYI